MQDDGGCKTVLLVDDDPDLLDIGSEILERSGFTVLSAGSGEEALEVFRNRDGRVDVVLMDLTMPGMDGINCMKELMRVDASVRVILMSGLSELHERKAALSEGAKAYLSKPCSLQDMVCKVKEVLET